MSTSNVALWQSTIDALVIVIEQFGQPMQLQTRSISAGGFNSSVDFNERFIAKADFIGAIDTNNAGKTIFDGSGTEFVTSHIIYLEFIEDITSEDWILYDNRRFDIVSLEDIGELNGILRLNCNERGTTANESNKA